MTPLSPPKGTIMSNNFYSDLDNVNLELEYAKKIEEYLEVLEESDPILTLSDHISNLTRQKIALEATIEAAETQKKIEREANRLDKRFGRAVSNMPKLKLVRPESEDETSDTTPSDS